MEGKEPLYIFVHTPKCAGTTIRHTLFENYKLGEFLLLYEVENKKKLDSYLSSLSKKQRDKTKAIIGHTVYYGIHKHFLGREPRYITFLRKPFDRTISDYNFQVSMFYERIDRDKHKKFIFRGNKLLSVKEWFTHNQVFHNLMFKFLLGKLLPRESFLFVNDYGFKDGELNASNLKKIQEMLDKFYFVGITERPEDFLFVYHQLGINTFLDRENVSDKHVSKKDVRVAKKMFRDELAFDRKLYEYAKKLNTQFKKRHKEFNKIVFRTKVRRFIRNNPKAHKLYQWAKQQPYKQSAILKKKSKFYAKFVDVVKRALSRG